MGFFNRFFRRPLQRLLRWPTRSLRDWYERRRRSQQVRRCSPPYNPETWNDENGVQYHNNCYNYACNTQTNTFAQPGSAGGYTPTAINCDEYTKAVRSDGLIEAHYDGLCPSCCYKVALAIWPDVDFHWYRQDNNGRWSHKPGKKTARNLDNSGNPITNPRDADRGPHTVFCGFFCMCKSSVNIVFKGSGLKELGRQIGTMQDNKLSIEVVLNIFSGRPNPKWMLSEAQVAELKERLGRLPPGEPKIPPGLGYSGFIITNLCETSMIPHQIRIFSSILTIKSKINDKETISHYKDIGNIEEWLLNQARELGYGNIVEEARQPQVWDRDSNAFEELAMKYKDSLYQLIRTWLNEPNNVLDCAQEAFIKSYITMKERRGPRDPNRFWSVLRQIAYNVTMDILREHQKKDNLAEIRELLSIDETTSNYELRMILKEKINVLLRWERTVSLMYYFEGFKEEEVAKILGRSQAWVNLKKQDGLKKLRKERSFDKHPKS